MCKKKSIEVFWHKCFQEVQVNLKKKKNIYILKKNIKLCLYTSVLYFVGTTREPRPGEVNGVDYTFLDQDAFNELEKNGSLLESGIFDGEFRLPDSKLMSWPVQCCC